MRLSVTSWSFPACSLPESWAIAKALGFSHMDIGLLHGAALDREAVLAQPKEAAKRISDAGIRAANLYWLFGDHPAERPISDPACMTQNLEDFERVCEFAGALSIPTIFVLPGVSKPQVAGSEVLDRSSEAMRSLIPLADTAGVALTVEPHVGGILSNPETTLSYLSAVPGLGLTLDYSHFVAAGFTQSAIDPLLPHARHIHLRQARPGALQAKWGEGTLDFGVIIESLRSLDYSGFLSVEYVHQTYMNTIFDDVLTETVMMRNLAHNYGIF